MEKVGNQHAGEIERLLYSLVDAKNYRKNTAFTDFNYS